MHGATLQEIHELTEKYLNLPDDAVAERRDALSFVCGALLGVAGDRDKAAATERTRIRNAALRGLQSSRLYLCGGDAEMVAMTLGELIDQIDSGTVTSLPHGASCEHHPRYKIGRIGNPRALCIQCGHRFTAPATKPRQCNMHGNCDLADAYATSKGGRIDHCHAINCEVCGDV